MQQYKVKLYIKKIVQHDDIVKLHVGNKKTVLMEKKPKTAIPIKKKKKTATDFVKHYVFSTIKSVCLL